MSRRKRNEHESTGAGAHHGTDRDEPVSLTSVPEPAGEEMDRRWHVYVIQMVVRIGCFLGALFTHGPLQIVLIVGAVVLPYTAVIFANAGGERRSGEISTVERPALGSSPEAVEPTVIEQVDIIDPEAPGTQAPGTQAPDTQAPGTQAPGTADDASDAHDPPGGATGPAAGGTRSAA